MALLQPRPASALSVSAQGCAARRPRSRVPPRTGGSWGSYSSGWCVQENTGRSSGTCVCRRESNGMGTPHREGLVSVCCLEHCRQSWTRPVIPKVSFYPRVFCIFVPAEWFHRGPVKGRAGLAAPGVLTVLPCSVRRHGLGQLTCPRCHPQSANSSWVITSLSGGSSVLGKTREALGQRWRRGSGRGRTVAGAVKDGISMCGSSGPVSLQPLSD